MAKCKTLKIVVLGAGGCGVSNLITKFVHNTFLPPGYAPELEDSFTKIVKLGDQVYRVDIFDASRTSPLSPLRESVLFSAHGFLLVYSVTCQESFTRLPDLWDEVVYLSGCAGPVVCIVGSKSDDEDRRVVARQQGELTSEALGSCCFAEVSAKRGDNVDMVFHELVKQVVTKRGTRREGRRESRREGRWSQLPCCFSKIW